MTVATPVRVRYHIDAEDRLDGFDAGWTAFAETNDGAAMLPSKIHGQVLWQFIGDSTTVQLYKGMLRRLRKSGAPVRFKLRCDSPDRRRFLEMTLTADSSRGVQFDVKVLKEELREAVPLLAATTPRSDRLVLMCAWCQRVRVPSGDWVEVEDGLNALEIFNAETVPRLSHGICPACSATLIEADALDEPSSGAPISREPV